MTEQRNSMPTTFGEWQEMFKVIYGDRNDEAYKGRGVLLLKLVAESKEIMKAIRKGKLLDLQQHIPDFFAWVFAYSNRHKIDLDIELWKKYPGVCPHCFVSQDCGCFDTPHGDVDKSRLAAYINDTSNRPVSLAGWVLMLDRIYGKANGRKDIDATKLGLHLLEEITEVADVALIDYARQKDETADVVAWLFALSREVMKNYPEFSLDDALYEQYSHVCSTCQKEKCNCPLERIL